MKMKLLGSGRAIKALSLLLVSYFYVLSGSSTVSISCNYYNGDGELSEDISVENAGFEGTVIILPYEMEGFSIFSEGKGQTADVHRHSKLSHKISATNMVTTNELQVDLKSLNARYSWVNKGTVSPDQADLSCASGDDKARRCRRGIGAERSLVTITGDKSGEDDNSRIGLKSKPRHHRCSICRMGP